MAALLMVLADFTVDLAMVCGVVVWTCGCYLVMCFAATSLHSAAAFAAATVHAPSRYFLHQGRARSQMLMCIIPRRSALRKSALGCSQRLEDRVKVA